MCPTDSSQVRPLAATLLIAVLAFSVLTAVLLAAVACGEEATIVGKWEDSTGTIFEFTSDGRVVSDVTEGLSMHYVIEGDQITFNSIFGDGTPTGYSLDGDTLEVQDPQSGEWETMTRVE